MASAGADGAVAADLGERGRDLGQADAVTAEALGHTQRRHTSCDECVPAVVPVKDRSDHIGDSLLFWVRCEVHNREP